MFSFSRNPINSSSLIERIISFHELVEMIRNPTSIEKYNHLHALRKNKKDKESREYKRNNIPWITPNVLVKKRELKEIEDFKFNFIQSSGYAYFDIDEIEGNLDDYKNSLINNYGDIVSIISKSASNRGISILVRVDKLVTSVDEYERLYDYITQTYFPNIEFDNDVKRLSSSWFIPFDKEVYVNHDNFIKIPNKELKGSFDVLYTHPPSNIHRVNPSNTKVKCTRKYEYIELSIREVFEQCNLETPVSVDGDFCISPTPILVIRFPRVIRDGSKRKVFRKIIHDLLELNPGFTITHVYLFIHHINENYADPKMEPELLKKVVESQFDFINTDENYVNKSKKTLRSIHYKNKGAVPRNKKIMFSNRFRGIMEKYRTFKRIQYAMNYLVDEHDTFTNHQISDLLGISLSTVKRHINNRKEDYEKEYLEFKEELEKVVNEINVDLL